MSVTLKNVKVSKSLTRETIAFTAAIYVDGKRAGTVENNGGGGAHLIYIRDSALNASFKRYAQEWAEKDGNAFMAEDGLINDLLAKYEYAKIARKNARRGLPVSVLCKKGKRESGNTTYYLEEFVIGLQSKDQIEAMLAEEAVEYHEIVEY